MSTPSERDSRALTLLVERGLFAKDFGMRQLVEVSHELSQLGNPGDLVSWTLISKDYVYTGRLADVGEQVVGR